MQYFWAPDIDGRGMHDSLMRILLNHGWPDRWLGLDGVQAVPYQYRIDADRSILWIDISDPTSVQEILEGVQRLIADPALYEGLQVISDHRNLDYLASPDLIRSLPPLFAELGNRIGPHRTAVVVSSKTAFGMTRMAEQLSDEGPAAIKPFWSMEEAEAWLLS